MNKKHLIVIFALVVALILPVTLIGVSLASNPVSEIAENALSYEGVAAKKVTQPGVRSMWRIDNESIKALEDKNYTVYYGGLMGLRSDANQNSEALTVTYDAGSETVSLTSGIEKAKAVTVYSSKGTGTNKYVTVTEAYSVFAYTTTFSFEDKELYGTDLVYAGWLVTVSDSGEVAYYYDYPAGGELASRLDTYEKDGKLFYKSFTLSAVCDYFVNEYRDENGDAAFADNDIMNTVVDESRAIRFEDLSLGFASGKSTHVGTGINLVSGIENTYLFRANVTESGYYTLRIRYALADTSKSVRFYFRSRFDDTAVSTFVAENAVQAIGSNGSYTVPADTGYATQKLYIYLTAGEHVFDLWTESQTTTAVSAIALRCDRKESDLVLKADIGNFEVRSNGYEVVENVGNVYQLRGYLSAGASFTTNNPTRVGYVNMKAGTYFDFTLSVGTTAPYEIVGDVGIGENSALHIYDITDMDVTTGKSWVPTGITPIFTADKATAGGASSRVTQVLGTVTLKEGTRTLRIYADGDVAFRSLLMEMNGVSYLTVNYVDENGKAVAPQKILVLERYAKYEITCPAIAGYRPNISTVSGYLTEDKTVTVTYTVDTTSTDRTVTFIYGFNGEHSKAVTAPIGESIAAPAEASISGYHLTWCDAYGTPVYNLGTVGDGTVLTAVYSNNVVLSVNASEMQATSDAEFLAGDKSLLKINHDSTYFTGTNSYLSIPVSVPTAGIYELRIKGVSDGDFDLSARVDGQKYVYVNHVKNDYFVRNTLAMTNAEKLGGYTRDVQLWIYLPEGEHTVDLTIKGGASVSGRKVATALALYSAEFTLMTGMREKGDIVIQQNRTDHLNGQGDSYTGGLTFTATGWIEYSLTVPKDGQYDIYFFASANAANGKITAWVDGKEIGSYTGILSNSNRGAMPVAFRVSLTKGTHTFRLSADTNVRTHVLGVVAAWSQDFVYHDVTFVYDGNSVTGKIADGFTATPPKEADKSGYILEWLDENENVVTDFTAIAITANRTFTARYISSDKVKVTVRGVSLTGEVLIPEIATLLTDKNTPYEITLSAVEGYKFSKETVSGTTGSENDEFVDVTVYRTALHVDLNSITSPNAEDKVIAGTDTTLDTYVVAKGNRVSFSVNTDVKGVYAIELIYNRQNSKIDQMKIKSDSDSKRETRFRVSGSSSGSFTRADFVVAKDTEYTVVAYIHLAEGTNNLTFIHTASLGFIGIADIRLTLVAPEWDDNSIVLNYSNLSATNAATYEETRRLDTPSNDSTATFTVKTSGYYDIRSLMSANGATTLYADITDANNQTVTVSYTTTGSYRLSGTSWLPCTTETLIASDIYLEKGTYTLKLYINNSVQTCIADFRIVYSENNREPSIYNATFIYGDETKIFTVAEGDTVTPPNEADKSGYILEWLSESGEVVTDFSALPITANRTFTAHYRSLSEVTVTVRGLSPAGEVLLPEIATLLTAKNTAYEITLPTVDGYKFDTTIVSGTTGSENDEFVDVTVYRTALHVDLDSITSPNAEDKVIAGTDTTLDTYVMAKGNRVSFSVNTDVKGVYAIELLYNRQNSNIDHIKIKSDSDSKRETRFRVSGSSSGSFTRADFVVAKDTEYTVVAYIHLAEGTNNMTFIHTANLGFIGIADIRLTLVAPEWDDNSIVLNYSNLSATNAATYEESRRLDTPSNDSTATFTVKTSGYYDIRSLMSTNGATTLYADITDANNQTVTVSYTTTGSYRLSGTSWFACTTETVIATEVYLERGTYTLKLYNGANVMTCIADFRIIPSESSANLSDAEIAEYNEFLDGEYTVTNKTSPEFVGKWQKTSIDGKEYAVSITSGSAFYFMTDGATSIRINFNDRTSHTVTSNGVEYDQTPYFAYTIDGGAPIRQKITDPVITLPDSGKHVVRVVMDSIYQYQTARWSQGIGFAVQSVEANAGKVLGIEPTGKVIHFYGDSITEGILALDGSYPVVTESSSSVNSYSWFASEALGAVRYNAGYGGTGILNNGSMMQPFGTTLAYDWKNMPVDTTSNTPDVIVINHGTNDGDADANGNTFSDTLLQNLRTLHAMYPDAKIVYVIPIWQAHANDIRATVATFNAELTAAGDTNTVSIIETEGWLTKSVDTYDNLHPHAEGAKKFGDKLAEALVDLLGEEYF